MAWVSPPTFVDGATLTAAQLNQLSDGVRHLNGLGGQSVGATLEAHHTNDTPASYYYAGRHTHRYLHIIYYGSNGDDINVYYGGSSIFHDGNPNAGKVDAVVDLQTALPGLAVGTWYELQVILEANSGGQVSVWWIGESQSASAI